MSIKNERLLSKAKKLLKKGQFNEAREIYLNILKNISVCDYIVFGKNRNWIILHKNRFLIMK